MRYVLEGVGADIVYVELLLMLRGHTTRQQQHTFRPSEGTMETANDETIGDLYAPSTLPLETAKEYRFPDRGFVFQSQAERTLYATALGYIRGEVFKTNKSANKKTKCQKEHCGGYFTTTKVANSSKAWEVKDVVQCTCSPVSPPTQVAHLESSNVFEVFSLAVAKLRESALGPFVGAQKSSPPNWAGSSGKVRACGPKSCLFLKTHAGTWCRLSAKKKKNQNGEAIYVLKLDLNTLQFFGRKPIEEGSDGSISSFPSPSKKQRVEPGVPEVLTGSTQQSNPGFECIVCCAIGNETFELPQGEGLCKCPQILLCLNCLHTEERARRVIENYPHEIDFVNRYEKGRVICPYCKGDIVSYKPSGTSHWSTVCRPYGWIWHMAYPTRATYEKAYEVYWKISRPYIEHILFLDELARVYKADKMELENQLQDPNCHKPAIRNKIAWIKRYLPRVEQEREDTVMNFESLELTKFLKTSHEDNTVPAWSLEWPEEVNQEYEIEHTALPPTYKLLPLAMAHEDKEKFPHGRTHAEKYDDLRDILPAYGA